MDYWEFLLQREGDQSWLPLETAQAEILEGRYRIMAHSSRGQVPVEIRISQFLLEEMPPRRRVLKRQAQTNEDGLLVVMPFRWLQPGYWEIRCIGGDAMSDLLGESWQYGVQLRVLSQTAEAELWDDGDEGSWIPQTDSLPATFTPSLSQPENGGEPSESLAPSEPPSELPQHLGDALEATADDQPDGSAEQSSPADDAAQALTADLTRQVFDVMFADLDTSLAQVPESPEAAIASTQDLNLCRIDLDQQALMRQPQQPLVLSGAIAAAPTADPSLVEAVLESLPPCHLRVRLRDPQTLALLGESQHSVAPGAFPVPFQLQIQLPEHLSTRLVLGEVALQAPPPAATTDSWGRASFTITAAMNELLEALANQSSLDFAEDYALVPLESQPDAGETDSSSAATEPHPQAEAPPAGNTPEDPDNPFPYSFTVEARPAEAASSPAIDLPPATPVPDPFGPPLDLFIPSSGRVMPPQIYRPDPEARRNFSPSLPPIPASPSLPDWEITPPTVAPPPDGAAASERAETSEALDDLTADDLTADDLTADDLTAAEEDAATDGEREQAASAPDLLDIKSPVLPAQPQATALEDDQDAAVAAAALQDFLQEEAEAVPNPWDLPEADSDPAVPDPATLDPADPSYTDHPPSQPEPPAAVTDAADPALPLVESPELATDTPSEDLAAATDLNSVNQAVDQEPEDQAVDQAFQSLGLQNRFWTRLSTLATEDHAAAAAYNAALAAAEVSRTAPPEPDPEPEPEPSPFTSRLDDEVVIYDDPEPDEAESTPATDLDEDLPVPTPSLIVPEGELVSGDGMTITITLPHYPSRMGVKLWISDPQTRTLLAEPRWLMDFSPDGTGQLESTIRLQVPFGCLQMTIGAIATDLVRQREGYKVSVQRTVIPPNLPPLSLDEFEI